MPRDIGCPNPSCGKSFQVPEGAVGYTVRCPHCDAKIHLTAEPLPAESPRAQVLPGAAGPSPPSGPVVRPDGEPTKIGRFEVLARLGSAGFGSVYRGQDVQTRAPALLHVINRNRVKSGKFVDHFLERAKAAAKLHHPRISLLREAGCDGSFYYIVSEFVSERNLEQALDAGRLPLTEAARIARDLAEALAYGHGVGIAHREVRPANVWLDQEGGAHLIGFGLAHWQDLAEQPNRDETFQAALPYLAPELAGGEGTVDRPASDQYSLGAVLYQMLTGQPPFSGPPVILLFNILRGELLKPQTFRPDVPAELEAICLRALARMPEQRFADCSQLAQALGTWLEPRNGKAAEVKSDFRPIPVEDLHRLMIFSALGPAGRFELPPLKPVRIAALAEPAPPVAAASPVYTEVETGLVPPLEMDAAPLVSSDSGLVAQESLAAFMPEDIVFEGEGPLSAPSSSGSLLVTSDLAFESSPSTPAGPPEPAAESKDQTKPPPEVSVGIPDPDLSPTPEKNEEPRPTQEEELAAPAEPGAVDVPPPAVPAPEPPPPPVSVSPPPTLPIREVARSPLVRQFPRPVFGGTVTIRNTAKEPAPGPFRIVLHDLPSGASLLNASGTTAAGEPYLVLQVEDLPPGRSLMVAVRFQKAAPLGLDDPIGYRTTVEPPP